MTTLIVVLRVIHISCSVFWTGAAIMLAAFVMPSARALGPDGEKFMQQLNGRSRLLLSMIVSSLLGVASGLILFGLIHGFRLGILQSGFGLSMSLGALLGVLALVHGFAVQGRFAGKIESLSKEIDRTGRPPTAEQLALFQEWGAKLIQGENRGAVLLAASLIAMSAARYL